MDYISPRFTQINNTDDHFYKPPSIQSLTMTDKLYLTGLLSMAVVFVFADQNLLSPNLSQIADVSNYGSLKFIYI